MLLDQSEASTVLRLEQKPSAKAAATDDDSPRFPIRTGNIFTFKTHIFHSLVMPSNNVFMWLALFSLHSLA